MRMSSYLAVVVSLGLLSASSIWMESVFAITLSLLSLVAVAVSVAYKIRHDFYAKGKAALVVSSAVSEGSYYAAVILSIAAALVLVGTVIYNAVFLPVSLLV